MKILEGHQGKRCSETEYLTFTHKRCRTCSEVKTVDEFYRKKSKSARGWFWDSYCILCRRAQCRDYGQNYKGARNARLREWRRENPAAARRNNRRGKLMAKYRLTEDDVEAMRENQGARCAICGRLATRLFVDHCHTTGRVRGLLCPGCNTFLGWYERRVDAVQKYLEAQDRGKLDSRQRRTDART